MFDPQVLAFAGIAFVLTITPGADTMLVIRNVFSNGVKAGLYTTGGICSGLFFHAILSGVGLSVIVVHSATAFQFIKTLGAGYLIYLGIDTIRKSRKSSTGVNESMDDPSLVPKSMKSKNPWRSYTEGMVTNILNPKVAIFYLAFLPQFISPGDPVFTKSVLLAGVHFFMGMAWFSFISVFLERLTSFISGERIRRRLESVGGAILIGFGISLALEQR